MYSVFTREVRPPAYGEQLPLCKAAVTGLYGRSLLRYRAVTAGRVLVDENVAVPVPIGEAGGLEVGEDEGADADVPLPDHRPPDMHAAGVPAGRGELGGGQLELAQRRHPHRQRAPGG